MVEFCCFKSRIWPIMLICMWFGLGSFLCQNSCVSLANLPCGYLVYLCQKKPFSSHIFDVLTRGRRWQSGRWNTISLPRLSLSCFCSYFLDLGFRLHWYPHGYLFLREIGVLEGRVSPSDVLHSVGLHCFFMEPTKKKMFGSLQPHCICTVFHIGLSSLLTSM